MIRFNQNILVNDFKYNITKQDKSIVDLTKKVSSQQKYLCPHENPSEVRMGMMFRSAVKEYERYESNIKIADNKYNFIDAKLQEVMGYLQEINVLVNKGSTGTYNADDRKIIANEVDQYLRQIVQVANSTYYGKFIFSGNAINKPAFEISEARVEGAGIPLIVGVGYKGDLGKQYTEISRGEYIEAGFNGNEVFWANNVRVKSNTVATSYISDNEQVIRIDGIEIKINEGDNLETIVDKINATNLAVKGEILNQDDEKFLVLEGTDAHEIWLEDMGGGTVLQDLGVIAQGGPNPPGNYAPSAQVYSESIFDKIIRARDSLFNEGSYQVGNSLDGIIKDSIGHIADNQAIMGTRHARLTSVEEHVSRVKLDAQTLHTKFAGLDLPDLAKVYSNLMNIQSMRDATLQLGARMIPTSLIDFLRR